METISATSIEEFTEIVTSSRVVWHATDSIWDVTEPNEGVQCDLSSWRGVTSYSPEDMVVAFRSGTRMSEVEAILAEQRQGLPLGYVPFGPDDPTLAQAISFSLPHVLEGRYGSWREWILGLTVMLGDGTVAKSGSKVVKSVAGYDAHKLFVGARGTLGIVIEVTLRVWPVSAFKEGRWEERFEDAGGSRLWIQRTLRTDFDAAKVSAGERVVVAEPETSTLWAKGDMPVRFPYDWLIGGRPGEVELAAQEIPFLKKAKRLLDPDCKLNPGALGVF